MQLQASLTALALSSIFAATHAFATEPASISNLAVSLGVSIDDITSLNDNTDLATFNISAWAHSTAANDWHEDDKAVFLEDCKSIVHDALDDLKNGTRSLAKRATGFNSPAARAQIEQRVDEARAQRDSSSRRRLLQCNSGTQAKCTRCAGSCSLIYVGSAGGCSAVALGAETLTSGLATPAVLLTLGSCLAVASGQYWQCIEKCIG
ncbi:hypothetical protein DDE82_000613 [Stemphylium lycopersici]|nr:hypothetical protein TW65_00250 [Stemphylium lycopersici]RAR11666.1 hypothetical protein DDE82_000613 [Stemphylium lycopersici]